MALKNRYKILMISYYFAPISAIATRRNVNIALEFCKQLGDVVQVISTSNYKFLPQDTNPVLHGIKLYHVLTFDYQTIKAWFKIKRKTVRLSKQEKESTVISTQFFFTSFFVKLSMTFPFNILLGEGGLFYILFGLIKALRIGRDTNIIYSSFSPFSDHIIAYLFKLFHPKVFWIADFRDFYAHPDSQPVFWRNFHQKILKKILKKSDLITVVSNGLGESLTQYNKPIHLVRNAVKNDIGQSVNNEPIPRFSITYTGRIYDGHQDLGPLFTAIQNLLKLEDIRPEIHLHYAGPSAELWNHWVSTYNLESISVNHGMLSVAESIQLQKQSAINLLLTWTTPSIKGILTGKFYEYLEAGRPILLLVNGEKDEEFENIFNELNCGFQFIEGTDNISGLENFILTLYQEWEKTKKIEWKYDQDQLKHYTWEMQVKGLIERINLR